MVNAITTSEVLSGLPERWQAELVGRFGTFSLPPYARADGEPTFVAKLPNALHHRRGPANMAGPQISSSRSPYLHHPTIPRNQTFPSRDAHGGTSSSSSTSIQIHRRYGLAWRCASWVVPTPYSPHSGAMISAPSASASCQPSTRRAMASGLNFASGSSIYGLPRPIAKT